MGTQNIQLKSKDEFMAGYEPVYTPLLPGFLAAGKSTVHEAESGQKNFKRIEASGDLRGNRISPKDTTIKRAAAVIASKAFKLYFYANQFVNSQLQSNTQVDDAMAQILDAHFQHADEIFVNGDGTSDADVINNGLLFSGDSNYVKNTSYEVPAASQLLSLHAKVCEVALDAAKVAGAKSIIFYGSNILPLFTGLHSSSGRAFRASLQEALDGIGEFSMTSLPSEITPSGQNGFLVVNRDKIHVHTVPLPQILARDVDQRNMEVWGNFLMGSSMLEVLAYRGVIRQPLTLGV